MRTLVAAIVLLPFVACNCVADDSRGVPDKLFGIRLGGIYDLGNPELGQLGDLPIARFAGLTKFLGHGVHYYFKPKDVNPFFEYREKRDKPTDQYFQTPFRIYFSPVISPEITKQEQLKNEPLKWEASVIEWADDLKNPKDAYFWAKDLCKTFSIDISVAPKITDFYESDWYECTFSQDDRQFEVTSLFFRIVRLSFKKEVAEQKSESVDTAIRKLQMEELRPY